MKNEITIGLRCEVKFENDEKCYVKFYGANEHHLQKESNIWLDTLLFSYEITQDDYLNF